jgi:hypothetical protein
MTNIIKLTGGSRRTNCSRDPTRSRGTKLTGGSEMDHWLNALGRWEAERADGRRIAELLDRPLQRLRGVREAAVSGVGINPRWRVSVRLRRRPVPPGGGGEAVPALRLVA